MTATPIQQRYQGYMRKTAAGADYHRFLETHYREAGVAPSLLSGIPQLEALELINKWNRDQMGIYTVFYLSLDRM